MIYLVYRAGHICECGDDHDDLEMIFNSRDGAERWIRTQRYWGDLFIEEKPLYD